MGFKSTPQKPVSVFEIFGKIKYFKELSDKIMNTFSSAPTNWGNLP